MNGVIQRPSQKACQEYRIQRIEINNTKTMRFCRLMYLAKMLNYGLGFVSFNQPLYLCVLSLSSLCHIKCTGQAYQITNLSKHLTRVGVIKCTGQAFALTISWTDGNYRMQVHQWERCKSFIERQMYEVGVGITSSIMLKMITKDRCTSHCYT